MITLLVSEWQRLFPTHPIQPVTTRSKKLNIMLKLIIMECGPQCLLILVLAVFSQLWLALAYAIALLTTIAVIFLLIQKLKPALNLVAAHLPIIGLD